MRRKKQRRQLIVVIALIVLAGVVITGRILSSVRGMSPPAASTLLVHCGNSMRPAAEELARLFEERHRVRIEFNYGGSESLFPMILTRREGDIFITHDPFGDLIEENGLLRNAATVGQLVPVIIVPKGNPRNVETLDDLLNQEMRVGVTDPRYTTAGRMIEDLLRERGAADSFTDHANFVLQTRSHGDVATALQAGQLDGGIVWNFIGANFSDSVDTIIMDEDFPETRVIVCRLKTTRNVIMSRRFLEFAASDEGRKVFADHGYYRKTD